MAMIGAGKKLWMRSVLGGHLFGVLILGGAMMDGHGVLGVVDIQLVRLVMTTTIRM